MNCEHFFFMRDRSHILLHKNFFLFSQNFVIIYFSMPGSFAGFTGFRVIRQRLEQAWALAHYTKKKPAAIGGWQLVKKGGYKKEGDKQFLRHCEFLNRIYEFSVFTMAVYGKNLGKTKTENSKNGFCIHNGGIILNIYIKVAFFCCPYELLDISRRIQTDFHFVHVIHADISFRTVSKFFLQQLSLLLVLFYAVLPICQHVRFPSVLNHFCEKRKVFVLFFPVFCLFFSILIQNVNLL